jgi:hypothetical protein
MSKFVMSFQEAMAELDEDPEITPLTMGVLMAMMNRMGYDNRIDVTMSEIARIKRSRRQSVGKAVKILVSKGVLVEAEEARIGTMKVYRLNPKYGFKGSMKDRRGLMKGDWVPFNGGRWVRADSLSG